MAFDLTSHNMNTGKTQLVFDFSNADSTTQELVSWAAGVSAGTVIKRIHKIVLGCACGSVRIYEASTGSKVASIPYVTGGAPATQEWNWDKDPVVLPETADFSVGCNICVSANGTVWGSIIYSNYATGTFDLTDIDYRSGKKGIVFDDTAADGTTQPLRVWDATTQKIFIHKVQLGCVCGKVSLFDGSAGSKIASVVADSDAWATQEWDFEKDPVQCDGTGNLCVSATGVVSGLVKYELGT